MGEALGMIETRGFVAMIDPSAAGAGGPRGSLEWPVVPGGAPGHSGPRLFPALSRLEDSLGLLELLTPSRREATAAAIDEILHHPDRRTDPLGAYAPRCHDTGDRRGFLREEVVRRRSRYRADGPNPSP